MSEPIAEKARRLVDAGNVEIVTQTEDVSIARVEGDTGVYRVTVSADDQFAGCSCPAVGYCSHIEAVKVVIGAAGSEPPESQGTDTAVLESTAAGVVEAPPVDGDERGLQVVEVDPETGEIVHTVENAPAGDVGLLSIAKAPITARTLEYISQTEFVPANLRGKPRAVLACVLYGRSMGLDPMQALAHVHVIDGRPAPSAELLLRLIRGAGHTVEVLEATDDACRLRGTRTDTGDVLEVAFTLGDAERAGLVTIEDGTPRARSRTGKPLPWESFTSDLLWARAVGRLHRRLFSDVTGQPTSR